MFRTITIASVLGLLAACAEPSNQLAEQTPAQEEPVLQSDGCYEGEVSVTTESGEQTCVTLGYDDPETARRGEEAVALAVALYNEHSVQHAVRATTPRTWQRADVRAFVAFRNLQCAYVTIVEWHRDEDFQNFLSQVGEEQDTFWENMRNMYQSIDHMGAYEHYDVDLDDYSAELRRRGLNACDSRRRL